LLLLPGGPLRPRGRRRRPSGRLPRCDDGERGLRRARLPLHPRPRARERQRRRRRPRGEARARSMRRLLLGAAALVVLLGGAAVAYVLYKRHQSRNIHGSASVEFVTTQTVPHRTPAELQRVPWPTYGRDDARQRVAE